MSVNISTIIIVTLLQKATTLEINRSPKFSKGVYALSVGAVILVSLLTNDQAIYHSGLLGIFIFSILLSLFIATMILIPSAREVKQPHLIVSHE